MPEAGKAALVQHLREELMSVIAERPDMNVVFASDGAAARWSSLQAMAAALPESFTAHTMDIVDAFHVAEYLQKAAEAISSVRTSDARIQSATRRETAKEAGGPKGRAAFDARSTCSRTDRRAGEGNSMLRSSTSTVSSRPVAWSTPRPSSATTQPEPASPRPLRRRSSEPG